MTNYDVVKKLIGPIMPIGETCTDNTRFNNLQAHCELVNQLLTDIDDVASNKQHHEFSIQKACKFANDFLDQIGIKNE